MLSRASNHIYVNCASGILGKEFMIALHAVVLIVGLLFITNFKLRKPNNMALSILVGIVAVAVLRVLHIW